MSPLLPPACGHTKCTISQCPPPCSAAHSSLAQSMSSPSLPSGGFCWILLRERNTCMYRMQARYRRYAIAAQAYHHRRPEAAASRHGHALAVCSQLTPPTAQLLFQRRGMLIIMHAVRQMGQQAVTPAVRQTCMQPDRRSPPRSTLKPSAPPLSSWVAEMAGAARAPLAVCTPRQAQTRQALQPHLLAARS